MTVRRFRNTPRVTAVIAMRGRPDDAPTEKDLRNELHSLVRRIVEIDRLLGGNGVALVELDRALEDAGGREKGATR
jgi:hypothetical protein